MTAQTATVKELKEMEKVLTNLLDVVKGALKKVNEPASGNVQGSKQPSGQSDSD